MIQDACEATRRQVKGLKMKQWFVRPGGSQYNGDLCDPGGTKGRAPRVQNIRARQRDFKDAIVSKLPSLLQEVDVPFEDEEEEESKEGGGTDEE
jgi:hypothetical protein